MSALRLAFLRVEVDEAALRAHGRALAALEREEVHVRMTDTFGGRDFCRRRLYVRRRMTSAVQPQRGDSRFWIINAIVSAVALSVLAYLLLVRGGSRDGGQSLSFMPAVNATFNGISAVLLTLGVIAIRKKRVRQHMMLVIGAFASSSLFLAGYLAYHYAHAETKYPGTGLGRTLYLLLLASHVILSVPVVPLCLGAFYYALTRRYATHKKITKFLYPIWLYVSVTGVVVFFLLRSAY